MRRAWAKNSGQLLAANHPKPFLSQRLGELETASISSPLESTKKVFS